MLSTITFRHRVVNVTESKMVLYSIAHKLLSSSLDMHIDINLYFNKFEPIEL